MYESWYSVQHACELPQDPSNFVTPPTASWCRVQLNRLQSLTLPCGAHHGARLYLRSARRLRAERARRAASLHPYSAAKLAADCLYLALLALAYMYMPLQVFYDDPNPYDPFILLVDLFSFLTLCMRFVTGYLEGEHKIIVLEPRRIAAHYLKTYFITDLIATLPLQLIAIFEKPQLNTVMFLFKLLRIPTVREQWKNVIGQLQLSHIKHVTLSILVQLLMFFQWMTFIHYLVPSLCAEYYSADDMDNWLRRTRYIGNFDVFDKYASNLFLVCGVCIGVAHYEALVPNVIPEMLLSSCLAVVGLLFLARSFTTLVSVAIHSQYESYVFHGRYRELEEHMTFLRLPSILRRKISLFINYKFNGHYFNSAAILGTVNEQAKQDMVMFRCARLVLGVPLLAPAPAALLNALVFRLKQLLYMPGEVAHLRDGSYFGENSLLQSGVLRTATVIALEITEIYNLSNKDFQACLQLYPNLKKRLLEKGNSMRRSVMRTTS